MRPHLVVDPLDFDDLVNEHGPDSLISKIGATMFGSTETTFYVSLLFDL